MEENTGLAKVIIIIVCIMVVMPFIGVASFMLKEIGFKFNWLMVLGIILGIIIIWFITTYNKFVSLKQKVHQAKGTIDVYLKKRFDLIPNLVETVKGYKDYEKGLLEEITKLRTDYESRKEDDIKQSEELNNRFTKILITLEKYPELKSSEQFLNLQKNLVKVESELQAARRIYNSEVTEFNTKRLKFPSNIIGSMFGYKQETLFEIEEFERSNIDIKL